MRDRERDGICSFAGNTPKSLIGQMCPWRPKIGHDALPKTSPRIQNNAERHVKEASVNFRSTIPALALTTWPLLPSVNLRQCYAILKEQLYVWHFSQEGIILYLSVHRCRPLGHEDISTFNFQFHNFLLMPFCPSCPLSLKTFHSANYLLKRIFQWISLH